MTTFFSWNAVALPDSAEGLYRPPTDLEAHVNDWFGVMTYSPTDCVPRNVPRKTVQDTYLVILSDSLEASSSLRTVLELADRVVAYKSLPLVEVECGEETARRIAGLSGVEAVLPAFEGLHRARSVVVGIDLLASFGETQQGGHSEGYPVGGRSRGAPPGYPVVRYEDGHLIIDADPQIEWAAEPAVMPVINVSVGTKAIDYPFLKNDIVNLATYGVATAGSQLIVISAGNCGQSEDGAETMSAWAQPPWVLSVGATADEDGELLAEYSARGASDDPESGPDVVAWGQSAVPPHPRGTSFAAPRVSGYALLCAAALLEFRHGFQVATGQAVEGVRLVGAGFIDSWGKQIWQDTSPRIPVPALPVTGIDMDGVTGLARLAADHGIKLDVRGNAEILRSLLLAAAKPIPGYGRHEIGAGFLSERILLDYLASLSGAHMLRMFATAEIPDDVSAEAFRWSMFDRFQLSTLAQIIRATAPQWRYDFRRQRIGARPFVGEDLSELSGDEQIYGVPVSWPPAPLKPHGQEEE